MSRVQEEKHYWNEAATDSQVDDKFISDIPDNGFLEKFMEPRGKVLEIGCGVGRLMQEGWCGIDISEGMLKIARKRKPECEFKLTDGRSIPYEDKIFDTVYCMLVFQHIPFEAVKVYIEEAKRVLKSGGHFIFQFIEGSEDAPFSKHHRIEDIDQALIGFGYTEKKGLVHPQWTWVYATKL